APCVCACRYSVSSSCCQDVPDAGTCTLSLHDALPIFPICRSLPRPSVCWHARVHRLHGIAGYRSAQARRDGGGGSGHGTGGQRRSEEHTSELQSRENLVCRLLLEKKRMDRPLTGPNSG